MEDLLSSKAGCQGFVLDSESDIRICENAFVGGGGGASEGIAGLVPTGFLLKGFVSVRTGPGTSALGTSPGGVSALVETGSNLLLLLLLLFAHGFSSCCTELEGCDVGAIPGRKVSGTFDRELDLAISFVSRWVSSIWF